MSEKISIVNGAVYTRDEACLALGCSMGTIKRLMKRGLLRYSQAPGMRRIYISGESISAMLRANMRDVNDQLMSDDGGRS